MSDISEYRVVTRADVAAALREKFGTDKVAWSIEPGSDEEVSPGTWIEVFVADPQDGDTLIGRGDKRFFDARVRRRPEGYNQLVLFEEPQIPFPEDGRPRVVGYIRVYVNFHGFVRTRQENTLIGQMLMIHPSSVSKAEPIQEGANLIATIYVYTNPQRLEGAVEVDILQMEFPDEDPDVMKVRELVVLGADGRSLSVAAKLMAFTNA